MNKRKLFVIIALFFLVFSLTQLITVIYNRGRSEISRKSSIDRIPVAKKETRFLENGCPVNNSQDWVVGRAIGCEASPDKKIVGKFVFNGLYEPKRYYELFIMSKDGGKELRVFSGDSRTLGWEWTEDNRIKILYNCGTGCRASKIIGINENISIADYENGRMSEKNGWKVEFYKSF